MSKLTLWVVCVSVIEEMISTSSNSDRKLAVRLNLISVANRLLTLPLCSPNLLADSGDGATGSVNEVEEGLGVGDGDGECALGFDTLGCIDGGV